jgi:hypothetical protein
MGHSAFPPETVTLTKEPTVPMAGQPSAGLLAELKRAGAGLTEDHLAGAIMNLERARVGFVVEAIALGVLLLAKKEALAHGGWQKFQTEVWEQASKANRKRASDLTDAARDNFVRSLRTYCCLGRHFLSDLEQGRFQPEAKDAAVTPPAVTPTEVLALDTLPEEKRLAVLSAIERFVAGRSLRRMLQDFRRAEDAANTEELTETAAHPPKPGRRDDDPAQLTFLEDLKGALTVLDTLLDSQELKTHATRDQLMRMADALEAHAKALRAQAKETAA